MFSSGNKWSLYLLILSAWVVNCGFNLPDEKKYLAQRVADISLFDANGKEFKLYQLLGEKPLIISPVYTRCASLCGLISNGVFSVIHELGTVGKDFTMISFSFDSTDTAEDLSFYESRWKMNGSSWKTVSASSEQIRQLMASVDYQYDFDIATREYNHPAILIVLTPAGRISRYIYGLNPAKKDIRLAVMEAMAEKTRPGLFNGFYLRCFGYDPVLRTYKIDWRFIISTSAGLLMILLITRIFIKSFFITKNQNG
ncbi:MAG: SCO family protein [Bacteroidia bacterium]|nr:SCO family protein [Bacteroidia bacterium]MCZ2278194.1 SCO family protein [Bacteroidia bacterium]